MPSLLKILHFVCSALATAVSVVVLGYGMSTWWAQTTIQCARSESDFFNGTAVITFNLFKGLMERSLCPSFGNTESFEVIPKLRETGTTNLVLYALVVSLLALCLLFSAVSILISLYNAVSNPYETYMGPIGVYTCSSLCVCLSVVALIIYVVNINVTSMAEDLVRSFAQDIPIELRDKTSVMGVGFYLIIPYAVLSVGAIALIYSYEHAAYTHRREQQRPTEDAPKEIMMY
ncbi:clarin-3 [Parambassis ranga]|uniref:Clarin-3 n=1 Tax=Parambassis ranga TaxID=210632 RepID=A0A6P7KGV0_9TELE|nr:clarin-3 [Parambassis ranga]